MAARPWRVRVMDIGPNVSFATEAAARARAVAWTGPDGHHGDRYIEVHVYDVSDPVWDRWVYRDGRCFREVFSQTSYWWVPDDQELAHAVLHGVPA